MIEKMYSLVEFAKEFNVGLETIRLYERKKLLMKPFKLNKRNIYSHKHLERMVLISKLKKMGFQLSEIKQIVEGRDLEVINWDLIKKIIRIKINEIDEQKNSLLDNLNILRDLGNNCELWLNRS